MSTDQPTNTLATNGERPKRPREPRDPAAGIKSAPPNFSRPLIPHVFTFQGLVSTIARAYRNPDEAYKHSRENARYMRNDCSIMECLEARQRGTALLDWHLDIDGPKMTAHEKLKARMTSIIQKTSRFTEYRRNLLEAIWFGKYANQNIYGWDICGSERNIIIRNWLPINGDKLVFRMDDGTHQHPEGQVGIRVGPQGGTESFGRETRKIEPTESGMAVFLEPWERALLSVHKHMIEDAAYESPMDAGAIHGIGVRSRIYWTWFQKQEILALLMEYVERTGLGFEIWTYPEGNPTAKDEVENAAMNRVGRRNIILFPKPIGDDQNAYGVEHFEPSGTGIDALKSLLNDWCGHLIKRYILGQILTSESDATGLGSGVADLHLQTFLDIVKYDASNLDETITKELVEPLKNQNDPKAHNVQIRFVSQTQTPDTEARLTALEKVWNMGARLKESEVLEMVGAGTPTANDRILVNPAVASQDPNAGAAPGAAGAPTFEQTVDQLSEALKVQQAAGGLTDHAEDRANVRANDIAGTAQAASDEIDAQAARINVGRYSNAEIVAAAASETDCEPTAEQRKAGNYRKGRCSVHGLPITIETPAGAVRSGVSRDGTPWQIELPNHYGYIRQTESEADGDHIDVFLGPDLESELVFVIDQVRPDSGKFDEHKVMIGWTNEADARKAYLDAYSAGWKGLESVTAMTMSAFKAWIAEGNSGKRIAEQVSRYRAATDAERSGLRWITIGGDGDGEGSGGVPVLIDSRGRIHGGPEGLQGKSLDALNDDHKREAARDPEPEEPPKKERAKSDFPALFKRTLDDHGIEDPQTLRDALDYVMDEHLESFKQREEIKAQARKLTGLTMGDVARLENQGFDYTSSQRVGGVTGQKLAHFDEFAQEVARQFPEAGLGDPDDPREDFGANLWAMLREGRKSPPRPEDYLESAAKLAKSTVTAGAPEYDEYRRSGDVARYRAWLYAKRQASIEWKEDDHPRDADGQFAKTEGRSGDSDDESFALKRDSANKPKPMEFQSTSTTQKALLSGLDDLPGQQDLFEGEGNAKPAKTQQLPLLADDPRASADEQAKADRDQYIYARESAVPNAGQDLLGSARHKANAWRGLEEAESDGTAERLVTRDNLLKNEPHGLGAHIDANPLSALAMHLSLQRFPPKPGYGKRAASAEDQVKDRRQYVETYRAIRAKAEEIAAKESNPMLAVDSLREFVRGKIQELRGQKSSDYMGQLMAADPYNATANSLVDLTKKLSLRPSDARKTTSVPFAIAEFNHEFETRHGDPSGNESHAANYVSQIMDGATVGKVFGTTTGKAAAKRFDPTELYIGHAERKGGKSIDADTPERATKYLTETLGLRGVQHGNYVSDDERRHHLTKSAEAMADLCDVLGLPPSAASLGGALGLAFGARGTGRALAHYEPGTKVINLTRAGGVGSLAHEWGHAFDHAAAGGGIVSGLDGSRGDYVSEQTSQNRFVKDSTGQWKTENGKIVVEDRATDPIWSAFHGVRKAMAASGFNRRLGTSLSDDIKAGRLSEGKRKYWTSEREKFARSFESYIQHKLRSSDRDNTYLSGVSPHRYWPSSEEMQALAPAFDALFDAYRKKEHPDHDPTKYSRSRMVSTILDQFRRSVPSHYTLP